MIRRPPGYKRTDPLFPYRTPFRAPALGISDPLNVGNAFLEMTTKMMADPAKLFQAQLGLWQDYMSLWQATTSRMLGGKPEPVAAPERSDRRFKDEEHTSELQSLMRISYAVFCLKKKNNKNNI